MPELSLEKFNPKKAELTELATKYQGLEIKGLDDEVGYKLVDEARKDLKKQRVFIEKQGKEFRADALKFQKEVIAYENDLVAIIEPLELELKNKQAQIDLEKEKILRRALLPARKEKLIAIGVNITDDEIISMDIDAFDTFYNNSNYLYLQEKDRVAKEVEAKLATEKRIKEAEERARKEAEEKAEKEKQAIIDENNRKEKERLEAEERARKEIEDKKKRELEEKAKLEKQEKYKKFLAENKYDEKDCCIIDKGDRLVLYRKVAEFIK